MPAGTLSWALWSRGHRAAVLRGTASDAFPGFRRVGTWTLAPVESLRHPCEARLIGCGPLRVSCANPFDAFQAANPLWMRVRKAVRSLRKSVQFVEHLFGRAMGSSCHLMLRRDRRAGLCRSTTFMSRSSRCGRLLTVTIAGASLCFGLAPAYELGLPGDRNGRTLYPVDGRRPPCFALVAARHFLWIVFEGSGVLYTPNPYNYGDLPLHWTYIQYFANEAPFWPENPIFTGTRLQYPVGIDLFNALLLKLGISQETALRGVGLAASATLGIALFRGMDLQLLH